MRIKNIEEGEESGFDCLSRNIRGGNAFFENLDENKSDDDEFSD